MISYMVAIISPTDGIMVILVRSLDMDMPRMKETRIMAVMIRFGVEVMVITASGLVEDLMTTRSGLETTSAVQLCMFMAIGIMINTLKRIH